MMYGLKPFNGAEMRAYLDMLNEAPPAYNPKGVPLPTAPTATPPGQDLGDQIIKKGGAAAIDAVASVGPGFKKASQDLTPGSPYYQKNIANNPALVKMVSFVKIGASNLAASASASLVLLSISTFPSAFWQISLLKKMPSSSL